MNSATRLETRRAFLKRGAIGLAAMTAAAFAAGRLVARRGKATQLPGSGSIFEPRRQDLLRHWAKKVARFRIRF